MTGWLEIASNDVAIRISVLMNWLDLLFGLIINWIDWLEWLDWLDLLSGITNW